MQALCRVMQADGLDVEMRLAPRLSRQKTEATRRKPLKELLCTLGSKRGMQKGYGGMIWMR
jgi:hypothetical protein